MSGATRDPRVQLLEAGKEAPEWTGALSEFLANNEELEPAAVRAALAAHGEAPVGGGAGPAFTLRLEHDAGGGAPAPRAMFHDCACGRGTFMTFASIEQTRCRQCVDDENAVNRRAAREAWVAFHARPDVREWLSFNNVTDHEVGVWLAHLPTLDSRERLGVADMAAYRLLNLRWIHANPRHDHWTWDRMSDAEKDVAKALDDEHARLCRAIASAEHGVFQ